MGHRATMQELHEIQAVTTELDANQPLTLRSLLSLNDRNQASPGADGSGNGGAAQEQRQYNLEPAGRVRYNSNTYQSQQADAVATELRSLEKLLTVDNNLTPSRTHLKEGLSEATLPPKEQNYEKPKDRSLEHIQGTGVEFEELSYSVVKKQKLKDGKWITQKVPLLHGITGAASKGEITAVMGPSGAGKSTLLDALAGRIDTRSLEGLTMVDGRPVTRTLLKRMSAYVMQSDQLFPLLTVWETLTFAAEIRLRNMSRAEKYDRVSKLIDQLGLTNSQNTYIGDEKTRGISGGEKRRVSIGVDIIHGPALLFMDEPTSGLDSTSAYSVIERVHDIAKSGSTVILTIHQPSSRILQHLNRLIVLARGQLVYQGSPNYLSTHLAGFGREVPRGENPTEYFMDVIQEYDKSSYGIDPLVLYNFDGTKFGTDVEDNYSRNTRTPLSTHTQKSQFSGQLDKSVASDIQTRDTYSKTPLEYKGISLKAAVDERIDAMEVGDTKPIHDYVDGAYDHSVSRDGPKILASLYYKGVLERVVDKFLSPRASPSRAMPSPPIHKNPGWMTHPSPTGRRTPMSMSTPSPMHKTSPFSRTNSRTPLRSPSISQGSRDHTVTSEIGPATPYYGTGGPHGQAQETESLHTSDCTVTERDFQTLGSDEYIMHEPKFANTWWREVLVLMFRVLLNIKRSPELFLSRQTTITAFGVILATMLLKRSDHSSNLSSVTSIMTYNVMTVSVFFLCSMDTVPAFINERLIYIRETSHNSYRASAYVMANAIVSVPFLAFQALSYALITWWALGFENLGAWAFWFLFLVLLVSLLCTVSFVMCISAVVPNYILAYTLVVAFTSLQILFCGYFVHRSNIPVYWIWIHYLSSLKYSYESLVLNEFGDEKHQVCYFGDPADPTKCLLTGKDLLKSIDITQLTKWEALTILCGMAIFYRILFYCVLRFGSKNQRR